MEGKSMSMDSMGAMGKAIAGRTARPCDVCGRERARWFCAADEAYLCERCDASVHSANAVARRHERARIGAPKTESRGLEMKSNGFLFLGAGTRRRARTIRPHPQRVKPKVKAEAEGPPPAVDVAVPEHESARFPGDDFADYEHDEELLPQVPIFVPALAEELSAFRTPDQEPAKTYESKENFEANCGVAVPESDLHQFLNSETDLFALDMDMDVDVESIIGQGLGEDGLGILGFHSNDFGRAVKVEGDRSDDLPAGTSNNKAAADEDAASKVKVEAPEPYFEPEGDQSWDTIEINLDYQEDDEDQEALTTTAGCESHEAEHREGYKIELELCSILGSDKKISLKLNYEDVLTAWSDRGSLWASYDDCISDGGGEGGNGYEMGLVPDLGLIGGQVGPMPGMINGGGDQESSRYGGREARVLRYREKRRTRLFSKKIRYEVRKLNAEKRPRMKGRFVKRTSGILSD